MTNQTQNNSVGIVGLSIILFSIVSSFAVPFAVIGGAYYWGNSNGYKEGQQSVIDELPYNTQMYILGELRSKKLNNQSDFSGPVKPGSK